MAARKGSTGSNTKKSTATRKTSGTAKKTSAGTGKKTQTKRAASGRSGTKRGTGSTAKKNTAQGAGSAVRSEISILVALALTLFGTLSVFGLCGSVGAAVRNFLYGVFGILACIVPLLFFLAVMFFVSNLGNGKALGKLAAALLIVPDLCGLIQLVVSPYVKGETLKEIYEAGTGGGWLGGAVKQGLCSIFDVVGAYLILILILLICLVVITEKSLTRWIRSGGERILGRAREDYDYRVEQNEENRVRNEELREERRTQREERRRKAEERRRQEEERREEHRRQEEYHSQADERLEGQNRQDGQREERGRRTNHKVRGVEIVDNTVIDGTDTGDNTGETADAARRKKRNSETIHTWDISEKQKKDSETVHTEDVSGKQEEDGATLPENTESAGGGSPWRSYSNLSGDTDPRESDRKSRGAENRGNAAESEWYARGGRGTGGSSDSLPAPEDETEDTAVEWWNPRETGGPVSDEAMDQLERELKHTDGLVWEDSRSDIPNGFQNGEDRPDHADAAENETFQRNLENPEGQTWPEEEAENYGSDGLPESGKEDIAEDSFADGVRRLDFMQERVNRRMEEFETAKPGRQTEFADENQDGTALYKTGKSLTDDEARRIDDVPSEKAEEFSVDKKVKETSGNGTGTTGNGTGMSENGTGTTGNGTGMSGNGTKTTGNGTGTTGNRAGTADGKTGSGKALSGVSASKPAAPPRPPYRKPPTSLLNAGGRTERDSKDELNRVADKLQDTLKRFGVNVTITDVSRGPSVTRYELLPEAGTRVNRITSLSDDIKLALAATDIRIEAPIPGKSAIGIEVPNKRRETVYLKELVESGELKGHTSKIAFAAGKDIAGKVVVADIAKMPHMLIAGTTGSGKSVFTNSIIMTILFRATPDEVKLIIIDPKVVEFGIYNGIPHLMTPVVTDPRKAAEALKWATAEMSRRYQTFANENVRDLKGYNKKIEREHLTDKEGNPLKKLPQIVIIIDELADLMMVAAKDVEETICRLAQLARAAGIHLIIATQRPSVDVVTGLIKANIPSRVALLVSSGVDSRTIIDMNGAEKLLGNGDMLFAPSGYAKPVRLQGAFVSDEEVRSVVDFLKQQVPEGAAYDETMFDEAENTEAEETAENRNEQDELFADAGRFLIEKKRASVSLLQRKFRVGFNRAARIIDQLEEAGVVGEELGTKPRNVLMTQEEFEEFLKTKQ